MIRLRMFVLLLALSIPLTSQARGLLDAIKDGHVSRVNTLLTRGADPNAKDSVGRTALMYAAQKGNVAIVKTLLANRADVNARSNRRETALIFAAKSGHAEVVETLLDYGAKVDAKAGVMGTALIHAVKYRHLKVVEILLLRGANKQATSYEGTPEDIAKALRYHEIAQVLKEGVTQKYKLTVQTTPADSNVRLFGLDGAEIPYRPGIRIKPGKYRLQIKKAGYEPRERLVDLKSDSPIHVTLTKARVRDTTPPEIIIASSTTSARGSSRTRIEGRAVDASGVAEVRVNGKVAFLQVGGNFSANVLLKVGENVVRVTALDIHENKTTKDFKIIRSPEGERIADSKGPVATSGKYYALVIGSNQYHYLPPLKTARSDAKAVDELLKETYGFETKLLLDATRRDIMNGLNEMRRKITKDDHFLLYYAGHGYRDEVANKAYWLPVDAENDSDTEWVIADSITSTIRRLEAKHVLVVADSCFSGTLFRTPDADIKSGPRQNFVQKMLRKPSRTLMASGGNEPVTDEGGGKHSIFADAFLRVLSNPEQRVFTAEEIFDDIKISVAGRSLQTPEYSIIRNSGHDGGDFVFIRR